MKKAKQEPTTSPSPQLITWLGENRDGLLVLGTSVYVFGYLVWAIYAWQHGLGLLPVLSAQYLVAGIMPALIVAFILLMLAAGTPLIGDILDRYPGLRPGPGNATIILTIPMIAMVVVLGISLLAMLTGHELLPLAIRLPVLMTVTTISFGILAFMEWVSWRHRSSAPSRLRRLVTLLIFGVGGIWAYHYVLFSHIPQALGGVSPRCAVVDIDSTKVSRDTLTVLGASVSTAEGDTVVRSNRLDVMFSSGDIVIVRIDGEVLEIDQDAIQVIDSCD